MIEIKSLTKVYKSGKGIFDLSLEVNKGEVFGYLGPNGAGKTTTIRLLMGFLNSDKGTCTINGLDCRQYSKEIQKSLGFLPEEIAFFDDMTGVQFLVFMREMRGTKDTTREKDLINRFELDPTRQIKKMSKGMKQKLGIITAFMHDPLVYILDEPTSGLDPLMQNNFLDLILEEKSRGKTIMMSSHRFDEIDRTCDRVGILREGHIVAVEDIHSIKSVQRKVFIVAVESKKDVDCLKSSGLKINKTRNNYIEIVVSDDLDLFIKTLAKCKVHSLDINTQSLEHLLMKYYGQEEK